MDTPAFAHRFYLSKQQWKLIISFGIVLLVIIIGIIWYRAYQAGADERLKNRTIESLRAELERNPVNDIAKQNALESIPASSTYGIGEKESIIESLR